VNIFRRLPLSRLLIGFALVLALGVSATALASSLVTGPTPPPKPLADAIHDGLAATPVSGVSADIQLTNSLVDASSLQSPTGGGGESSTNPLLSGASGRLWISDSGKVRLELQSDSGDTQVLYDGQTLTLYDASSNTVYEVHPPQGQGSTAPADSGTATSDKHQIPTVQQIQDTITKLMRDATVSGAIPTDVAGQPAYQVHISPSHDGGLVGGATLAWDATHGAPLDLAIYATGSSAPVLELKATNISYGPVADSVFAFTPPAGAKVNDVALPGGHSGTQAPGGAPDHGRVTGKAAVQAALPFTLSAPDTLAGMAFDNVELISSAKHPAALLTYGKGLGGIAVLERAAKPGAVAPSSAQQSDASSQSLPAQLPQVAVGGGAKATELPTALGTVLSFDRGGVSYVLAGSVTPAVAQAAAQGL
jgi:outer membrane lipoprotein-sorting protein